MCRAAAGFATFYAGVDFSLYDSDSHLHDGGGLGIAGPIAPAGKAVKRPLSAWFPA